MANEINMGQLGRQLLVAVDDSDINRVRELLDRGADVNFIGSVGETPLMVALLEPSVPIVRLLLERGADKTIRSNPDGTFEGKTALELIENTWYVRPNPVMNAEVAEIVRLLSPPTSPPGGNNIHGGRRVRRTLSKKRKTRRSRRN